MTPELIEAMIAFIRKVSFDCRTDPEGEAQCSFDSGPYCEHHGPPWHTDEALELLKRIGR